MVQCPLAMAAFTCIIATNLRALLCVLPVHIWCCTLPHQAHEEDQLSCKTRYPGCMTCSFCSVVQVAACLRFNEEAFTRLHWLSIQPGAARQPMPVYQVMSWDFPAQYPAYVKWQKYNQRRQQQQQQQRKKKRRKDAANIKQQQQQQEEEEDVLREAGVEGRWGQQEEKEGLWRVGGQQQQQQDEPGDEVKAGGGGQWQQQQMGVGSIPTWEVLVASRREGQQGQQQQQQDRGGVLATRGTQQQQQQQQQDKELQKGQRQQGREEEDVQTQQQQQQQRFGRLLPRPQRPMQWVQELGQEETSGLQQGPPVQQQQQEGEPGVERQDSELLKEQQQQQETEKHRYEVLAGSCN